MRRRLVTLFVASVLVWVPALGAGAAGGATATLAGWLPVSPTPAATTTGATDLVTTSAADTGTAATTTTCPCSVWPATAVPGTAAVSDDPGPVTLGVKVRSDTSGYVTALRFYKGTGNTGTHVGRLWTAAGQQLAQVTFTNETATGWQQATLPNPVPVTANTTYIASYDAPTGHYADDLGYFTGTTAGSAPLHALADGTDGGNGVYGPVAAFPTNTWQASNYWVDVVFDTTAADTTPPTIIATDPATGATGVPTNTAVRATFSEPMQPGSATVQLTTGGGSVTGRTAYDQASRTVTFTPASPLSASTAYTATVSGGADAAGNVMQPVSWSFSTAAASAGGLDGPGGPVLVISTDADAFSRYPTEILRAEGLDEFTRVDLSAVTPTLLAGYEVAVLSPTSLTAQQVTMLTDWVNAGGNLVALRPSASLASLLGLTATPGTVSDAYLKVDTTTAPGTGITGQVIQYHGPADLYTLSAATAVATLYATATTATANPAVTLRSVGTNGGHTAAFTYDLNRSIAYTRQGNPAWAAQERDGVAPIRSDDKYFGGSAADWVDLSKVAIPQADEQQRLLANLVETMTTNSMPLPRFWYFPRMAKAVVVATGDDHANGGTAGRFDQYLANSPAGCVAGEWQCARFTSYVFPGTPLSDAAAKAYVSQGFEVSLHPDDGCQNFTPSSLDGTYSSQLGAFAKQFPSVPAPVTSRTHCIVFSDWATQPLTELSHGIRLDANYYYWPGSWVQDRPGFMTGSGIPMRFTNTDGSLIDVYQAATQMTDESQQSYPYTVNTLLDNALGPLGYYGAFTANMHTDQATTYPDDQVLASALARGVPIVSAAQLLTWLTGRDASSFGSLAWSGSALTFTIGVGTGADGLTALLPTSGPTGTLSGLTLNGSAAAYTKQVVKGVEYAVFSAQPGSYRASYSGPPAAPAAAAPQALAALAPQALAAPQVSDASVFALPDGTATVSWTTGSGADSLVEFGTSPDTLDRRGYDDQQVTDHAVVLTELEPDTRYYYRVASANAAGDDAGSTASFVSAGAGVADSTAVALRVGTADGVSVTETGDGELTLTPTLGDDFSRPGLSSVWRGSTGGHGRVGADRGALSVDGGAVRSRQTYDTGRSVEFSATFTGAQQLVGFGDGSGDRWAAFRTVDGRVVASVDAGAPVDTALSQELLGSPHRYRIDWTRDGVTFSVDGRAVARQAAGPTGLGLAVTDGSADSAAVTVDWVRLSGFHAAGTYLSRVLDAHATVTWKRATWAADVPAGTRLRVSVRTGDVATPDASWTPWRPVAASGSPMRSSGRYLQYRVEMSTSSSDAAPVLSAIGFTYAGPPPPAVGEGGHVSSGRGGRS